MNNNLIDRDSIYVGKLVKLSLIERNEDTNTNEKYIATNYEPYRSILFTIDKDGLCNDLIYNSPKYAILNHSNDDIYWSMLLKENKHWNVEAKTVIIDSICIGGMLQRLGFDKKLNFDDIKYIKNVVFNKKILEDKCYSFGLIPNDFKNIGWYEKEVLDKKHHLYVKINENYNIKKYKPGPMKLWFEMLPYRNAIARFGSDKKIDFFKKGFNVKLNAFKPSIKEGKIKVKTINR